MSNNKSIGIYFVKSTNGYADSLNIQEIKSWLNTLPEIKIVWDSISMPLVNKETVKSEIKKHNLTRLIISGFIPGLVKPYFSDIMAQLGYGQECIEMVSFREHEAILNSDTEKAKAILLASIKKISLDNLNIPEKYKVNPQTLVIGGGIAGIQASLEIANSGNKVFLLEKTGTIGGHMAMFDKTFPTLDCAACILTPKMVEVGQHENIELLTYSEIKEVTGHSGDFNVIINKKARKVDIKTCIGCGSCTAKCPSKVSSEFDDGTTLRKAIYIPFPQAVPNKYLIDADNCTYIQSDGKKCGVCVKFCPVNDCINLDAMDEEIEINVGNIMVTTGFKIFDAKRMEQYGYGKYPNVLTSLELERLINASGPTEGKITFRSKDKKDNWIFTTETKSPKSVAFIHCVGSRDENYNKYCSKVCCMYSLKLAHLVKEKLPKAEVSEYYIDMRAFGKGYEEFYERIKNEGINVIRGRTAKVEQLNGHLLLRSEDIQNNTLIEKEVDMVILAVGLEPRENANDIGKMLNIVQSEDGWYQENNYISDPVNTNINGITIAGACQGPKDIPDTVAQASAAAARVIQNIIKGKVSNGMNELSISNLESMNKPITIKEDKS